MPAPEAGRVAATRARSAPRRPWPQRIPRRRHHPAGADRAGGRCRRLCARRRASDSIGDRRWPSRTRPIAIAAPAPAREVVLPLPRRGEMALGRARSLAAGGRLREALAVLDDGPPGRSPEAGSRSPSRRHSAPAVGTGPTPRSTAPAPDGTMRHCTTAMKCPKCEYLGFEEVDRCRNCGYEFSLSHGAPLPESAAPRPAGHRRPSARGAELSRGDRARSVSGVSGSPAVRPADSRRRAADHQGVAAADAARGPARHAGSAQAARRGPRRTRSIWRSKRIR